MKSDLGPIRKRKIYEQVARQIRDRVLKNLNPGDKLPPERELAERLGVSRSSVRDAIRSLELVGAVEPRSGAGTVVREMSTDWIMNPVANVLVQKPQLLGDLLDFRKILEPPLAALAAKHAVEAGRFGVVSVERKRVKRNPPPPFTTSTLQQEAAPSGKEGPPGRACD